jgi:ankyrin repeat protein
MKRACRLLTLLTVCVAAHAAEPARIDFGRDVLPIFRQNCFSCHGPSVATSDLRLDRKSSAFKDGFRRVVPGNLENSHLYDRLVGNEFGMQMPPTGPLKPAQIALVKSWIEQGAEWPDSLSNEAERAPLNPQAVSAVESLRGGNTDAFLKALTANPRLINARGPDGATPLMFAALYGDAPTLEQLLKMGGNSNLRNDSGATALMWAAPDFEKTRVLIVHGADVNAASDDLRTPLMIAAGMPGAMPAVKLLLEHGAKVNPTRHPDTESSPLVQAALAADPAMMQILIDKGADLKSSGNMALLVSLQQTCSKCVDLMMRQNLSKDAWTGALQTAATFADAATVKALLDRGADVNALDPFGHTALVYAAGSDSIPADVVKLLIDRGADVNLKSSHKKSVDTGMSVLDVARLRGQTPVVDLLVKAGARSAITPTVTPAAAPAGSARDAIARSLPVLQKGDAGFTAKAGCVSCHNDSLTAMALGAARAHGFPVDETIAKQQVKVNVDFLDHFRELHYQGTGGGGASTDTFWPHVIAYVLIGLDAENYRPDLNTDAAVMYIKARQMPEGNWPYTQADTRPPLCSDYVTQTALSMRALQLYPLKGHEAGYEKSVALAAVWLARVQPKTTEDYLSKLLGLAWAARDKEAIAGSRRALLALQRQDGGWGDLPTLPSSAYATGKALVALHLAGLAVSDPAYKRGADYLLKHQLGNGSWYVPTRALGFQPFFETGFPNGVSQSISSAGTGWSTMALLETVGAPAVKAELRRPAR